MSGTEMTGSIFFRDASCNITTVTGENYLVMLQARGDPVIYFTQAFARLLIKFPDRWIDRRVSLEWARRSPYLPPWDLFLWDAQKHDEQSDLS